MKICLGNADIPILYHVDKTRDGRTYCARSIKAVQSGRIIFTMQASFKQPESFITAHQLTMPEVPHPDQLETATEALERFRNEDQLSETSYLIGTQWYDGFPAIIKWIEPDQLLFQKACYPRRLLWVKAKGHIDNNLHQNTHKCCLAYLSDSFMLQTALMRLAPIKNRASMFNTSLDHIMWFHAPCKVDQWLLFQLESDHLGDGRAFCRGSIWDINGTLVTTVAQEGVIRHEETPSKL
uniref:Acyl-CoA thioesterase-like C-terminal domain-containing protein n=1 Tax=Arion vulgaris TaxID=1028688 RepID=A0A0B6Y8C2_9EUPU